MNDLNIMLLMRELDDHMAHLTNDLMDIRFYLSDIWWDIKRLEDGDA